MGIRSRMLSAVFAAAALLLIMAAPAFAVSARDTAGGGHDPDRVNPLAAKALGQIEKTGKANFNHGQMRPNNQRFDNVLTLLVEFSDEEYSWTDSDGVVHSNDASTKGPQHNMIAPPGPSDNTSYWVADFSPAHYQRMLFNKSPKAKSMFNYYLAQSGGAYAVDGRVYGWVKVPHSEAYYGAPSPSNRDRAAQQLVVDAVAAAGSTIPWAAFDKEDPYDLDGDGNYTEPDGYVDHIQLVHAGVDQSASGGAQGEAAIWAHSWGVPGGAPTSDPKVKVLNYTINPEDGTIGVFTHEFGHDLGLPDQYDTAYSGEASTGFWTLMSSGSWLSAPGEPLGTSPADMNIWEKWVLGWAKPDVVIPGQKKSTMTLKAAESSGSANKGVRILLPDYEYSNDIVEPHAGAYEWYSGSGDLLENTLTHGFTLPAAPVGLSFWTWFDIEEDWDYGFVEVSTDGGATWATVPGNITTNTNPNGNNEEGNGITGASDWVNATFDLSAWAGTEAMLRFRYSTDAYVVNPGWAIDDITLTGGFSDGAEAGEGSWTADGWSIIDGAVSGTARHYYIMEWREPIKFDASMNNWYNFIDADVGQAEFFKAGPGLVIWYRNLQYGDNNVGNHPWAGQLLVVDSHPELVLSDYGWPFRTRIQIADAAFGVSPVPMQPITSFAGYPTDSALPALPGVPLFDDSLSWVDRSFESLIPNYWINNALSSVETPTYGVKVRVNSRMSNNRGGNVTIDFSTPLAVPILP